MILPARTLWDTRIQCVVGIVLVEEAGTTEVWLCGNFGQVSIDPPRIIINPNRLYAAEAMIRRVRRFSLNVLPESQQESARRLVQLRRREPGKLARAGWTRQTDEATGLPTLAEAMQVLCCEVEQVLDTGDHTVMISRVVSNTTNPALQDVPPLRYPAIAGRERSAFERGLHKVLQATGAMMAIRKIRDRLLPQAPPNLPEATYRLGGQTDAEIAQVLSYPAIDTGRIIDAPEPSVVPAQPPSVCVVGTHWGASHYRALRKVAPAGRLFLCGRDEHRTSRLAKAWGAEGYFIGVEAAASDPRVQGLTLAMPHHLHREAATLALAAGKQVLVEKPIAHNLADADAMIAAARKHRQLLMVAENMHYRPTLGAACRRVRAGDIGEPVQMIVQTGAPRVPEGWVADREKLGGGVFMDIGIHYIRSMRLLVGEPDQVMVFRAMQINTKMSGEDGLTAVFSSRHGWQCHMMTTWSTTFGIAPDIMLLGDRGTIHLWPMRGYFDYYPHAPRPVTAMLSYVRPYSLQVRLMKPEHQRVRTVLGGEDTGYPEEMAAFLAATAKGSRDLDSAIQGRRDLEIAECVYRAMGSGRPEPIPAPQA